MGSNNVSFLEVGIFVIVVVLIITYFANQTVDVALVKSDIDGRSYLVRNLPDRQKAADMLARLNKVMIALVKHMQTKYGDNKDVRRLVRNFNPDNVSESSASDAYTSYTTGKGEKLVFCLRAKDAKQTLLDLNLVVYVAIHELGHLMTKEIGHTPTFWANNKLLLNEAIALGLYHKIDFDKAPADYCGLKITTSIV